jgi:hypothetical protein
MSLVYHGSILLYSALAVLCGLGKSRPISGYILSNLSSDFHHLMGLKRDKIFVNKLPLGKRDRSLLPAFRTGHGYSDSQWWINRTSLLPA